MRPQHMKVVRPPEAGDSELSYGACDVVQAFVARGLAAMHAAFGSAELVLSQARPQHRCS